MSAYRTTKHRHLKDRKLKYTEKLDGDRVVPLNRTQTSCVLVVQNISSVMYMRTVHMLRPAVRGLGRGGGENCTSAVTPDLTRKTS